MHDLIIVGAGTAGSVLAERLTASGRHRVLLVEAGGDPSSMYVGIPAGFYKLFKGPHDWNFESEPQAELDGRRIYIPRGKMLGGSSNINAQIHQWCHPADFDEWAAAGATGWEWQDVAPVFRAQEQWRGEEQPVERGRGGPMVVSPQPHRHPLAQAFVAAARAAGLGDQPHYNGSAFQGAWLTEMAHRDGRRYSAYDAYLKPALARPNLTVLRNVQVTRVVLEGGRATGIMVRQGGEERAYAAGGVVLAAGAFGSPHLLLHSGVGPGPQLQRHGIAVTVSAPEVGANLQDHPLTGVIWRTTGTTTLRQAESIPSLLRYLISKRGMLTSNVAEAIAFTHASGADLPPNVELLFVPGEWRNQGLEPPQVDAFTIAAAVVKPVSRGRLWLRSADPLAAPAIDFGLFTDPEGDDRCAILLAARLARRIAATAPLRQFAREEQFPGATVEDEDAFWAELCTMMQTVYHPTSTCRMGSDAGAVVDPSLRVRGVERLWVADASVMPSVPRGHPNAVVAMVGHRAADLIAARMPS